MECMEGWEPHWTGVCAIVFSRNESRWNRKQTNKQTNQLNWNEDLTAWMPNARCAAGADATRGWSYRARIEGSSCTTAPASRHGGTWNVLQHEFKWKCKRRSVSCGCQFSAIDTAKHFLSSQCTRVHVSRTTHYIYLMYLYMISSPIPVSHFQSNQSINQIVRVWVKRGRG